MIWSSFGKNVIGKQLWKRYSRRKNSKFALFFTFCCFGRMSNFLNPQLRNINESWPWNSAYFSTPISIYFRSFLGWYLRFFKHHSHKVRFKMIEQEILSFSTEINRSLHFKMHLKKIVRSAQGNVFVHVGWFYCSVTSIERLILLLSYIFKVS